MKNFTKVFFPLLFLILGFTIPSVYSQTYNLHWGSTSWTAPTYSKTIPDIDGSGIDATINITNSSPAGNVSSSGSSFNNAFQYNSPALGSIGGIDWFLPGTTASNPLVLWVNWDALTYTVTTVITFSRPVNDISFYLGDMDRTNPLSYVDRFTFTGTKYGIVVPNPIVTKFQAAYTSPDTVLINGNTAYGNAALSNGNVGTSGLTSQGATIFVQFGNPVTELTLLWDQGPGASGNPGTQAVVISDIKFSRVNPEYPPTADNFINKPIPQGNDATIIPRLIASDLDGTVVNYSITSLPSAAQGVLSIPCPATPTGATCTSGFADLTAAVLAANPGGIVLTPAQAAAIRFDPLFNFSGNASFSFHATDNHGNISNTANYVLPVLALPPVSNNIMENSLPNTNGPTAIQGLSSSDVDGTVAGYQITSLPPAGEGVLSIPCPATLTGGTCTGGFQDLTAAILALYPSGIPLTTDQMAGMRFAPATGFTGKSTFNYNATDNSDLTSNIANYTIPVSAISTTARPPLADNIFAQPLNNSLGSTPIPLLQASDLDGTIASYAIHTIPAPASGILYCCGGAAVTTGQILTPAQASTLEFNPAPGFTGTAVFDYTATDNSSLESNTATYNIPVVNTPPIAVNINAFVPFNSAATVIPVLSGSDADGTITAFTVASVPSASQGVLSIPCPPTPAGGTCSGGFVNLTPAVLAANAGAIVLTPAQAAAILFAPTTGFSGTAPFTYSTTDNNGNVSAIANYKITVIAQPPASLDILNAVMPDTNGPTSISGLSATDPDGTITSYRILGLPDASQGIVSITCPVTPAGATCAGGFADLTEAVLAANPNGITLTPAQATALRFDPTAGFTGLAAFKYVAVDNDGFLSNYSSYTIPVSGSGNIPPIAKNIVTPSMQSINGSTAIPTLLGSDADGTIDSFTLNSIPDASQGVLSIPCPVTPTGATCTGGFANLTAAVLAANPAGIMLTPAQAAGMRFDPEANFSGNVEFAYSTTDDSGAASAGVVYTIPVTTVPPTANPVVAPSMSHNNAVTAIPGLVASDPDGTIATYYLESIPAASQGVLSVPCPVTLTGATCTGGFQNLTSAVLSNYAIEGLPLTIAQMAGMRFAPAVDFTGNVIFNYHATDNTGLLSNTSTYTIPVTGMPPISNNVLASKMYNNNGPTAIPALNSSDPDGSITNYVITSLPPISQGTVSIPCAPTPTGATCAGGFANLTAAVLAANPGGISLTPAQSAGSRFAPNSSYSGDILFNYAAYDNNGNISNVATYSIPVGTLTTLPLTLINFNGNRFGNNIVLYWQTANEVNTSHFEIEYSTDAARYSNVNKIVTAKNNAANNYQLTLYDFTQPIFYFRLKSIDRNGNFTYSPIVIIRLTKDAGKSVSITPNPVTDVVKLKITSDVAAMADVQIISQLGAVVYKTKRQIVNGDNFIMLTEADDTLANGIYLVKVVIEEEVFTDKFVLLKR